MKQTSAGIVVTIVAMTGLLAGCATDLTGDARYRSVIRPGEVFQLKQNAFYFAYGEPTILPAESKAMPFSVASYMLNPEAGDRRFIRGIVGKGTLVVYEAAKGTRGLFGGLTVKYYGRILSGPFQKKNVCITHLLFADGEDKGMSDRYVERMNRQDGKP
jgi:hypothetical protein